MSDPVTAERWFLAHEGRLLQQDNHILFTAAETDGADIRYNVDDGFGLAVLAQCPAGMTAVDGLRSLLARAVDEAEYARLARASQLATWHDQHRFCGRCGNTLEAHLQDLARQCPGCGLVQYPRISPCIIVLVTRGDRCLLAHSARFPAGRYSTLAGFIEAGETAEAALKREVHEEVGIEVNNIRFFASQSWPFPHQLMLGFFADHVDGELAPDGEEILQADWFGVDDLPDLPPPFSIARRLIDHFFASQAGLND
ncbi:NAD(+) diphosphatase [Marinobacterium sp. MBR-109]|jgi:NAD+ diphosphatase|uniref:NAD(+) diphosphatase n=1 Tax=Marinobacterium sp. MBR-109 TaxID=3156462 RepID=UPI00339A1FDE